MECRLVAKGGGRGLLYFTLFAPGQVSLSLRSHRSNNLIVVVELCAGSAEFADDFGEVVRERRHKLGVSQEEFADICGLDWTYGGGIERGERNVAAVNIDRIAKALKVSLSELFRVFKANHLVSGLKPSGKP